MSDLVPSYLLKIERAVEHLDEFKRLFADYANSHPYTVASSREDKKQIHRLHFTRQIDLRAEMIAADFIYNIRSGLDHLAAALNPPSMRSHVAFPIHWQGVWEPDVLGENSERRKARERWSTSTRDMKSGAVAVLKKLQPPENGRNADGDIHFLKALNGLSNRDRHSQLPLMSVGLASSTARWKLPDGSIRSGADQRHWGMVRDDAELDLPDGAMDVEISGTPKIAIRAFGAEGDVEVPQYFERLVSNVRELVFVPLYPFICAAGRR